MKIDSLAVNLITFNSFKHIYGSVKLTKQYIKGARSPDDLYVFLFGFFKSILQGKITLNDDDDIAATH